MTSLRLVGYWSSETDQRWPDVRDFVDEAWDDDERAEVGAYLVGGTIAHAYMGYSPCRICGVNNGALEYTDGTYIWPEGLSHYVDHHGVRLPAEFVRHALDRLKQIEHAEIDQAWWRAQDRRS